MDGKKRTPPVFIYRVQNNQIKIFIYAKKCLLIPDFIVFSHIASSSVSSLSVMSETYFSYIWLLCSIFYR